MKQVLTNNSPNADRIYRVYTRGSLNGDFEMVASPAPIGAAFEKEIPGVKEFYQSNANRFSCVTI